MTKELRDKYVRLADEMRETAVVEKNDLLLKYARRLTAMTNTIYESTTNEVVEGYKSSKRRREGVEEQR